jgi:hypothetical protein
VPSSSRLRPRFPAARRACLVALCALVAAAAAPAPDAPPPLPEVLPSLPAVKDGVFAVLLGLVESDSYGTLGSEHLGRDLARRGARSRLPYAELVELRRSPEQPGRLARVEARFRGPLNMSVPYTILGYHPGSIRADETCVFGERRLGDLQVPRAEGALLLQDVRAFELRQGRIRVDFDRWLDWLMGKALDDTTVSGIFVFRLRGRWIGQALGLNDSGQPRSGSFDFEQDKALIPPSEELKAVARHLRQVLKLLPAGQP